MKTEPLKIGNKKVKLPLLQGGMGIGISLGRLAGAVAKEGGVGMISAAQIGYRDPEFDRNPKEANLRAIAKEYRLARAASPEGLIGFNIMVAMRYYDEYVEAAVCAGADLIVSGAGLPMDLPRIAAEAEKKCGREGQTLLAPIVSTEKSARVILKYWDKKYSRMPDLVVIEGPMAGGHLGFTGEQLEQFSGKAYRGEVAAILETLRAYGEKYGKKIPAALGGGIRCAEDVEQAFELGVDAIQVATRFVTTEECDADERYKETYLRAQQEDICIVKSPVGMPGRAILNPFMKRVMSGEKIPHTPCHQCLSSCRPAEIPYCITDALVNAARGNVDDALLFCGAHAFEAEKIETVKEVMDSLFPGR